MIKIDFGTCLNFVAVEPSNERRNGNPEQLTETIISSPFCSDTGCSVQVAFKYEQEHVKPSMC